MSRIWRLPMPPSTNNLYRNVSAKERAMAARHGRVMPGRVKTDRYKGWTEQAGLALMSQGRREMTPGYFAMSVMLCAPSPKGHIDADNIKALADLLVKHGLVEDDSLMSGLTVFWAYAEKPEALVTILPAYDPWEDAKDVKH